MTSFVLYGQKEERGGRQLAVVSVQRDLEIRLSAAREESEKLAVDIADDDVVSVTLDGELELWMRGDELREELGAESRDGGLTLRPAFGDEAAARGVGGWVVKGLRILGIDPTEGLVEKAARNVEAENHNQLLRLDPDAPRPWTADAWQPSDGPPAEAADQAAVLLFLHGTFSSTLGSFGELFKLPGPMDALGAGYAGRIYGFEHRTLTESPVTNALALVQLLPDKARLHLVSHSRGGLVGDLLSLGGLGDPGGAFSADDLALLDEQDRDGLPRLLQALRDKQIRVERFVRVASPSRGTTLASGRLDRWLSVVFHLLKQVPMLGNVAMDAVSELILSVVKQPQDADTVLPGIRAMMPDAPMIGLLNRPDLRIPESSRLAAIAGDIEETGIWGRLKLLLPDLFFAGDHDLVVNTGSMYGGPRRTDGWFCFDQGANVNHFNYFGTPLDGSERPPTRPVTVDALLLGLLGEPPGELYRPLAEAPIIMPARRAAALSGRRAVLFVLPGIMGSSLAVRDVDEEVWLSPTRLARGQLTRLRMEQPLPILPTGLIGLAYAELVRFMDGSHDVLPFPYDWRLSVRDAAGRLADEVARALDRTEAGGHPVRILAHSMGGLVARAMIADRPDLWQRIRARGGRLVMLGTPNRGSWEIVRLLVAQASTLRLLALVDLPNGAAKLLAVIRDFPGVLELLPDDRRDFFSDAVWRALRAHDEAGDWQPPGRGRPAAGEPTWLSQARETRTWLRERAVDPAGMVYVAGQAPETASAIFETERRRFLGRREKALGFFVSARGDSSVLWDDGLLPGVPTWYAPGVGHGDLAADQRLFRALQDLLVQGHTRERALQRNPPVSREADERRPMLEREPAFYPDEATLLRAALAMRPPRAGAVAPRAEVAVSVTHGSLAFARHLVAVGHYQGDTIIAAEAYLDRVLDGRLSARHDLGLYPGALGTHALFDHPTPGGRPPGALVVGLGAVGELTPSDLSATFARALLALARQTIERSAPTGRCPHEGPLPMTVSSLLIGTSAGGMTIQESVRALLRGAAQANHTLEQTGQDGQARITEVELVELWEARAIDAMRALHRIASDPELGGAFRVRPLLRAGTGGLRGVGGDGDDPDWWHRLQVLGRDSGSLRFTLLTQRARAEETLVATQAQLVDRFVERAGAGTAYDANVNLTLFEMLLPVRLKDGPELRNNLVLVLDEEAARYPWEMLEDRWSQPLPGQPAAYQGDGGQRPRSVEFGLLRQLKTGQGRERPIMAPGDAALVVGDPQSDFVPLPGARKEAERVGVELGKAGYRVSTLIEPKVETVITALHADAYRVLHLAGHGVHRERLRAGDDPLCSVCGQALPAHEGERVSGMIIGEGMVLTPADVEQMRRVPELVFINCCHLGRTDDAPARRDSDRHQAHRLAANLAVAFIGMGVRAVVAAGWAVDDLAAQTFAERFYRHMTDGTPLGEAIRLAREATWREHPQVNTWGAYQCYGDPDFRLKANAQGRGEGAPPTYVAPAEVRAELHNLRAEARCAQPRRISELEERLRRIERALEHIAAEVGEDWRKRGDIAEALGLAQGEVGRFADAAETLAGAIAAEDAGASWYAVDQRVRHQARHARVLCQSDDPTERERGAELFAAALAALDDAERHPERSLTRQRYRSRAAVHWRRVPTLPAAERAEELDRLREVLGQAARALTRGETDALDPYSRLLWLAANLLRTAYGKEQLEELCPGFDEWCTELKRRAPKYERDCPSILAGVIDVEVELLQHLARADLAAVADTLLTRLRGGLQRGASRRQLASLVDYVELLQVLAAEATHKKKRFRGQADALGPMLALLHDWHGGGGDAG
jgi:hypothetical protein